ncbi:hypothetical protein F5Y05DRAFT_414973 [Hypoxylon sp. FL0543]|nr:hypothetical protein F5Y05DRAFT_414973 [Hypoxylon sp. FL0543]
MTSRNNSRAHGRSHGQSSASQSNDMSRSASQRNSGSHYRSHGSTSQSRGNPDRRSITGNVDWIIGLLSRSERSRVATLTFQDDRKRPRENDEDDGGDDSRRRKSRRRQEKSPARPNSDGCGNCGKEGHSARDCVKVGRSGWMDGACPKCNSTRHFYDNCPIRNREEDLGYLFWYRQNKGPIKSSINVGRLLRTATTQGHDPKYAADATLPPPYSPKFARQIQRDHHWARWVYRHEDQPDVEATHRWYEPRFYGYTLGELANLLDHPGWSRSSEDVDPSQDGRTPKLAEPRPENLVANADLTEGGNGDEDVGAEGNINRFVPRPPKVRTGKTLRQKLEAERELRRRERPPGWDIICRNCGMCGHKAEDCAAECGGCGSADHKMPSCSKKLQICLCEEYPRHLRENCDKKCFYCPQASNYQELQEHTCMNCPVICHFCLGKDHNLRHCTKFMGKDAQPRRNCRLCDESMHLASYCIYNMCPVLGCKDPIRCSVHCDGCGWEMELDEVLENQGHPPHRCQWIKTLDIKPALRRVLLLCKKNNEHPAVNAEDLQDLRRNTVQDELSNGTQRWIECLTCEDDSKKEMEVDQ